MTLVAAKTWLEMLVGEDPNRAGTPRLQWGNLPESWGVFVLLAVIGAIIFAVVWMYRREINTCPMPVKLVMSGLRLAVLLLLVILFLKPELFYQQVNEIKPTIAVLRDNSLSLDRADEYRSRDQANRLSQLTGISADEIEAGTVKRSELINAAFGNNQELIRQLRQKGALRFVDFSTGSEPVALVPAIAKQETALQESIADNGDGAEQPQPEQVEPNNIPPLQANGLGTDIWQALRDGLDDGARLSAMVLVSEGQHNGTEDPLEMAQKAAAQGIPVYVVGVGDPNPPRNVAVKETYVRDKAYPDEPFEVEAILQSSQLGESDPRQIDVELIQQLIDPKTGKPGAPVRIKTSSVEVPASGGRMRVDFDHTINQPGKYLFTIQTPVLEGETETEDNQLVTSEMEVVDAKVKVLLISGLPSWDYQQVSRLLERDSTIELSCWLQSMDETRPQEGNVPIQQLPKTQAELNEFNVVLMMDPNPNEFDAEWIDLLKTFCKQHAGGLMFMAGPQYSGEFVTLNRLSRIRELLPVRLGDDEYIETTEVLASAQDFRPGKMLPVSHNMDHPIMAFRSDPAETQAIWDLMPGIYWNFPAIAAKPTGRVLLERGDQSGLEGNQPLMVTGRYGKGTVLYLGFQGTFRWRPVGVQAQYFDRFWIQVVRFLVETRSLQGARRGYLDVDKSEFELGERITLVGEMLDQDFRPSTQPVHTVQIRSDDGRTQEIEMKLIPNTEGRYEGGFSAQRTGSYEARYQVSGLDADSLEPIAFRVVPPSAESSAFWLNEKLLIEIAEQSGGKYLPLTELESLPDELPTLITRAEFNSPPKPLWDSSNLLRWLVYLLPVMLLTTEWIMRKWYKLL